MSGLSQIYAMDPDGTLYNLADNAAGWYFLGIEGIRFAPVHVIDGRTPYLDGATLRGKHVPTRLVVASIGLRKDTAAALQAALTARESSLSPHKIVDATTDRFTLRLVTLDGRTRCLDGLFTEIKDEPDGPLFAEVFHTFYASDPFFYDPTQHSESLSMPAKTGFSFPLSFPVSFAATEIDGYIYPNNVGDVVAWPVIRIVGPADDPVIVNDTTGKTIGITQSQDTNDYIEIDMRAGTVVFYDATAGTTTSILETLSAASEFWSLNKGVNTIHITASGASGGAITLSWYNRYVSA